MQQLFRVILGMLPNVYLHHNDKPMTNELMTNEPMTND